MNMTLRMTFGPGREEVTGDRRKLHNEELHDFFSLLNIIRIIKSRRLRQMGHVTYTAKRSSYRCLVGKPGGKRPLQDLALDTSIILQWLVKKHNGRFMCLSTGRGGGIL
jgi:hypothetical protein